MLYFLKGITAALEPGLAVMECAGVGYACKTTSFTLSGLQLGKPATLYTHERTALNCMASAPRRRSGCFCS